jgi:hypothetical protein
MKYSDFSGDLIRDSSLLSSSILVISCIIASSNLIKELFSLFNYSL